MTIHFYLERHNLKSEERKIYAYIRGIERGRTMILSTGQRINPIYWDKLAERSFQRGKNRYNNALELNSFLDGYKSKVTNIILQIRADNSSAGFDDIKSIVEKRFGKNTSPQLKLFEVIEKFIEVRKSDLTEGSLKKFKTLKSHLKEFEKTKRSKVTFENITLSFMEEFRNFLLEDKEMINNSAYKMIGLFKNFLNWATDRNYNKYQDFKKFKLKEDTVDIVTLDESELKLMREYDFRDDGRLDKARDLFLFGCYTGGRFSDLVNIERSDIRDGWWYLRTKKTRDIIEIPLTDNAQQILLKYKSSEFPLPRISNQKLNKYIKEVAQKVELNDMVRTVHYRGSSAIESVKPKFELVCTHTARRTFITESLRRGMRAEVIMRITGHRNLRTMNRYINITSKDTRNELEKAWQIL